MEPLYALTQSDRDRNADAIQEFENRRGEPPFDPAQRSTISSQVMRMTTAISWGETGLALLMKANRQSDGSIRWEPASDSQYQVSMIGGNRNRIDKGCFVQCVLTAQGWVIVNSWLMGVVISIEPIPFGVYAVRGNGGSGTSFQGHLNLSYPYPIDSDDFLDPAVDSRLQPWELDYVFGCQHDTDLATTELSPVGDIVKGVPRQGFTDDGGNRLIPVQDHLPAWAAYDQSADDSLPAEVLEGLGWDSSTHPNANERWGPVPGTVFKLKRTATVIALYWWEHTVEPRNEIIQVIAAAQASEQWWLLGLNGSDEVESGHIIATAPASVVRSAIEAMSGVGSGNVTVTGPDGGPYTIEFTGDASLGFDTYQYRDDSPYYGDGSVRIVQSGRAPIAAQWIAPNGWWGNWGWGGWGFNASYPFQSWYNSSVSQSLYGNWGYGWWDGRWGGLPPSVNDIVYVGDEPPAPSEGTITRYCVHSYLVWQYGWKVLSVNQEKEIAFIIGDLKFERTQVVVNADITDCPTYTGPGANPGT